MLKHRILRITNQTPVIVIGGKNVKTVHHCLSECEYSMVYFTVIKTVEIFMFGI